MTDECSFDSEVSIITASVMKVLKQTVYYYTKQEKATLIL